MKSYDLSNGVISSDLQCNVPLTRGPSAIAGSLVSSYRIVLCRVSDEHGHCIEDLYSTRHALYYRNSLWCGQPQTMSDIVNKIRRDHFTNGKKT